VAARYKLREAVTAVRSESETGVRIVTLPPDTLLELAGAEHPSGLVNIRWNGQTVAVFNQDLKSRAKQLDGPKVA
jgi:hypothetical protein